MTAPPPATPTQTPTARARSAAGNDVVMTDSVTGMTAAAPSPHAGADGDEHRGVVDDQADGRRARRRG